VDPSRIGLHGNNKSDAEIRLALEAGIHRIFIDSMDEVHQIERIAADLGVVAPVMARLKSGIHAGGNEYIATAHEDQKFGMSLQPGTAALAGLDEAELEHWGVEASDSYAALAAAILNVTDSLDFRGIHCHIGSQIFEAEGFEQTATTALEFMNRLNRDLDVTLPKIARAAKAIKGANLPVTVQVDGMTVQTNDKLVYMAFNKPAGVVSTMEDPEGRPCISDFLRSSMSERVFHVGRLDVETEGLLLLTNDGELANRLTHPSYEVPKTYLVQVPGPMEPGVGAAMKKGIRLEDGVTRVDEFKLVDSTPGHVLVEVTIHSGKNRIVRRLFDAVGYPAERLVRVEMGPIRIGSQKQGTIRNLSKVEIGHLLASVDM